RSKWMLNESKFENLKQTYADLKAAKDNKAKGEEVIAGGPPEWGATSVADTMKITFRAVSRTDVSSDANTETAYVVLNELRSNRYFDSSATRPDGEISRVEPPGTFSFKVTAKLKQPLKL